MAKSNISFGNVKGDVFGINVSGKNNTVTNNKVQARKIRISKKKLSGLPKEYSDSLKHFSKEVNARLEESEVPEDEIGLIQDEVDGFVEDLNEADLKKELPPEKKEGIRNRIKRIAGRLKKHLPSLAETAAALTPLAPFSKVIGESVEELIN